MVPMHAEMHKRAFVLLPLISRIAPGRSPVMKKNIKSLLSGLKDGKGVLKAGEYNGQIYREIHGRRGTNRRRQDQFCRPVSKE